MSAWGIPDTTLFCVMLRILIHSKNVAILLYFGVAKAKNLQSVACFFLQVIFNLSKFLNWKSSKTNKNSRFEIFVINSKLYFI